LSGVRQVKKISALWLNGLINLYCIENSLELIELAGMKFEFQVSEMAIPAL
jgi:hypothetical protein